MYANVIYRQIDHKSNRYVVSGTDELTRLNMGLYNQAVDHDVVLYGGAQFLKPLVTFTFVSC